MPFSQFTAAYDPETLNLLTRVFDEAWEEATTKGAATSETRQLLAARILQAFADGVRDHDELVAAARNGIASN